MAVATHPRFVLVGMAYTLSGSAFIGLASRAFRHRGARRRTGSDAGLPSRHADADDVAWHAHRGRHSLTNAPAVRSSEFRPAII